MKKSVTTAAVSLLLASCASQYVAPTGSDNSTLILSADSLKGSTNIPMISEKKVNIWLYNDAKGCPSIGNLGKGLMGEVKLTPKDYQRVVHVKQNDNLYIRLHFVNTVMGSGSECKKLMKFTPLKDIEYKVVFDSSKTNKWTGGTCGFNLLAKTEGQDWVSAYSLKPEEKEKYGFFDKDKYCKTKEKAWFLK